MKILILLILPGLILAEDFMCAEPPIARGDVDCLRYGFANYQGVLRSFKSFLCAYKDSFNDNLKNNNKRSADLINGMYCSGCNATRFLSQSETFAKALMKTKNGDDIVFIMRKIADTVDFTELQREFFCNKGHWN